MRSFVPGLATAATLLTAVAIIEVVMPPDDFAPFVMSIEATGQPPSMLRYVNRSNWSIHAAGDEYTYACQDGLYGHFDATGVFDYGRISDAIPCPAPTRWIAYGWAWSVPWPRTLSRDTITYTNGSERVVFDSTTGLPLLYEAGPPASSLTYRVVFTIVK